MSDFQLPYSEETPTSITINGIAHAVMMLTPTNLKNFAIGFAYSEGIISSIEQIRDLDICEDKRTIAETDNALSIKSILIDITLSPRQFQVYKKQHNFRRGLTGCGLCGTAAFDEAFPHLKKLPIAKLPHHEVLTGIRENSPSIAGVHFSKLLTPTGELLAGDEDIGRHNALDKILGFALRKKIDLHQHYAVLSSRCSAELVQKAVKVRLSTLIHLSSPSNLAVQMAKHYKLNLIQVTRSGEIKVHSDSEKVAP